MKQKKGILVVSGRSKLFMLPGGGARKWESRRRAAIRELKEETSLDTRSIKYLFNFSGKIHKSKFGGYFRQLHKVFLIKCSGKAKPCREIKYLDFYKPGREFRISGSTKEILDDFYRLKRH